MRGCVRSKEEGTGGGGLRVGLATHATESLPRSLPRSRAPPAQTLRSQWMTKTWAVGLALCIYLSLFLVVLCLACRGATKAKKRKKKNAFEMTVLEHRELEASHRSVSADFNVGVE